MIGTRAVVIGIEVGVEIEVIRHRSPKSAYDLVKMKKTRLWLSHIGLVDRIVVEKFRIFPFSFDSAYESVVYKALNA